MASIPPNSDLHYQRHSPGRQSRTRSCGPRVVTCASHLTQACGPVDKGPTANAGSDGLDEHKFHQQPRGQQKEGPPSLKASPAKGAVVAAYADRSAGPFAQCGDESKKSAPIKLLGTPNAACRRRFEDRRQRFGCRAMARILPSPSQHPSRHTLDEPKHKIGSHTSMRNHSPPPWPAFGSSPSKIASGALARLPGKVPPPRPDPAPGAQCNKKILTRSGLAPSPANFQADRTRSGVEFKFCAHPPAFGTPRGGHL